MTQNRVQIEVTGDSKSAEDALGRASQKTEEFAKAARKVGIALAAIGAAGAVTLSSAIKGALAERQGINLLDAALRNVGTSYKANAEAIEQVIASQNSKTNFSDDEQREALQRLVALSGDYRRSLENLPLVLDVAAGLQVDLSTASNLVGRAIAGNTEIFARYGIKLRDGATWTEALDALTKKFGGSAEAAADPLQQLNNAIDDLKDSIGAVMLPLLVPLAAKLQEIAKFLADHPTFAKAAAGLLAVAAAVGAIGVAFLVIAPLVSTAGLVVLAIAGIAAAGVLLWANWETVKKKAEEYWPVIQSILLAVFGPIVLAIEGVIAAGVWLWKNWETIKTKAVEIWNGIGDFFAGLKDRWDGIWDGITEKFNTVKETIIGIKDGLVGAFQNIWGFITTQWDNVWKGVHDEFDRIVGLVIVIRDRLVDALKAIVTMVGDPLAAVWGAIKGGIDNVIGLINGAIGTLNKAIDAYNKIPILPDIPNIPKINEGYPSPGDSDFIGPMQKTSSRGASGGVVNNVSFNFENVSMSESRRQIGGMLREIVADGGLTDVGLQRS